MSIGKHIEEHIALGGIPKKSQALGYARPAGKIVLLGSSIVSIGDADASSPYFTGTSHLISGNSPFHRANFRLGCPFTSITNAGSSGGKAADIYTAFKNTALPANPDWIYLETMRNDCAIDLANGYTIAQIRTAVNDVWTASVAPLLSTARNMGIGIIFQTIPPGDALDAGRQEEFAKGCAMVNRRIMEYCYDNKGAILFDLAPVWRLYTSAANIAQNKGDTQYFSVAATVHQNPLGGQVAGDVLYDTLKDYFQKGHQRVTASWDGTDGDVDNALTNSILFGTAGTTTKPLRVTGNIATSWDVNPYYIDFTTTTVVCAKVTHWNTLYPAVPAQSIRVTVQPAHVAEDLYFAANEFVAFASAINAISGSQFAVGDTVFGEIAVDVTENSGTAATTMLIIEMTGSGAENVVAIANAPTEGTGTTVRLNGGKITDGVLRTKPFVIPTGTTHLTLKVVMLTSAGGDVTWKFATPQLCKSQTYT